jgi:hypothetical protein
MNLSIPENATKDSAKSWLIQLVSDFGPGFHPDTDPVNYIDENENPLFSDCEVKELNKSMDIIFQKLGDPYEIGFDVAMWMLNDSRTEAS